MPADASVSRDAIRTRVAAVLAGYTGQEPSQIDPTADFEDLGVDSLDAVSLVFDLEQEFDVMIPNDEALEIRTLNQTVDALDQHIAARNAQA